MSEIKFLHRRWLGGVPLPRRGQIIIILIAALMLVPAVFGAAAEPPTITVQPKSQNVVEGSSYTFTVAATGEMPLLYQWQFNGATLQNETNATLALQNIQSTNAGGYQVIVSNPVGTATSAVAVLTVRGPSDPAYATPENGWAYTYTGDGVLSSDGHALDGTWDHKNQSDSWAYDGRGAGNGLPGGVSSTNGILSIEDAVTSGTSDIDNRRYFFTHNLKQESTVTNASTLLNDGVTLSFRARLTPPQPLDPQTELTGAPFGYVNSGGGRGMFGIRQAGGGGMIISFSLNEAIEDINTTGNWNFGQAGLHMNNLNGNTRSAMVDPNLGGVVNLLPLDPTVFHEFWINIQDNGSAPGTHQVTIYVDGSLTPTVFNVTAGTAPDVSVLDASSTNYIALGLGNTPQRGAVDVDYFAYKPSIIAPATWNEPVGIVQQPTNQFVAEGQVAVFNVGITGTPPFAYQWFKNGEPLPNATNATYTTAPATPSDTGAEFVVVVSNFCNIVTSAPPAVLNLLLAPSITVQPEDQVVPDGQPAGFSVTVNSEAAVTYQWRYNSEILPGQTSSNLSFSAVTLADAGLYDVLVSNVSGTSTSRVARLTVQVFDFGDAPEPYSTLLTSNGARHEVRPGIFLGLGVDPEPDGTPDPSAAAETDDDGVRLTTVMHVGQVAGLEVVASTNGYLNAWIDFNRNGTWAEAGEQIFTNQVLVAGTNILNFDVPPWASPTNSFARFRFNTAGNVSYDGPASDGEVEDYTISIEPVADLSVTVSAEPVTVAQDSNVVYTVTVFNAGPSAATEVNLTSQLSPAATPVSIGNCVPAGNTLTCTLGNLAPQEMTNVNVTVNAIALGVITNLVSVSAHEADFVAGNNTQSISTVVQQPATISVPPASQIVTQGQTATFTVVAEGAAPLYYQWLFNGASLLGETNSILQITNAQVVHEGSYAVRVFNEVGGTVTAPATFTVLVPPAIVQQPQSSTNNAGSVASLSVVVTGTEPLGYQWYFNATNALADATNSTLVLSNVQASQSGEYHVLVSNVAGTATSESAHLAVFEWDFGSAPEPPYSTSQTNNGARHLIQPGIYLGSHVDAEADGGIPGAESDNDGVKFLTPLPSGQNTSISVVASTNGWLNAWVDFNRNGSWSDVGEQICLNQWLEVGTNNISFSVPVSVQYTNTYARFRFSSARDLTPVGDAIDGEVEDYQVTIGPAVDLDLQLRDQPAVVALGSNVVITLLVTNLGPLSASSVTLVDLLPAAAEYVSAEASQGNCTNNGGVLTCDLGTIPSGASVTTRVTLKATAITPFTNFISVTSAETDINPENNHVLGQTLIQEVPSITRQPQSLVVTNGDAAVFAVTANGTDLGYQWFMNGNPLAGANGLQLLITNASPSLAGAYTVQVTNLVGTVLSEPASLTVIVPAHITAQPQSVTVVAGQSATFQVQAEGTEPLSYQWQFNGLDLPGETRSVLALTNVQAADQGQYRVRVGNMVAEELSSPATLSILELPVITQQPRGRTNYAGSTASLQVVATSALPLQYQWYSQQHGMMAGETSDSIIWTNVQKSATGDYWVVVSNAAGAVTSQVARLAVFEVDFGDAPNSYSTLLAFNGARHEVVPGIYLGSGVDFEPDGQADSTGTGDNANGQNDEDGVSFKTALYVGQTTMLEVVASTNGFLDAWIDFNANGTWADWEDQVYAALPLAQGTNVLSIPIPSTAVGSNTFARFRFSAAGGLGFDGPAADGEVEDYPVQILSLSDLAVTVSAEPAVVLVGSNYVYNIVVTNFGPSRAEKVILTNILPSAASVVSITASAGSCVNNGGILICDLLALDQGEQAAVTVQLRAPQRTQMLTNTASVWCGAFDSQASNNQVRLSTPVIGFSAPFANGEMIILPEYGPAAVYPSTLAVSGMTAAVYNVSITLSNFTHTYPPDLSMILVGPGGQSALLMSGVGSASRVDGATITFDDDAGQYLSERIISGKYMPTSRGTPPSALEPPAPPGPYATNLAVFRGTNPNGLWSLYIVDNSQQDGGYLANGWSLNFETLGPICDLGLTQIAEPATAIKGSNLTYTISVTNGGPAGATHVVLTDRLPTNSVFVSATAEQGSCVNTDGVVTCTWENLPKDSVAKAQLVVNPTGLCFVTNQISVVSDDTDMHEANNSAELVTQVKFVATLNPINDITIDEDSGPQVIQLAGISSGDTNQPQSIIITASSSDTGLLPNPVVEFASPQTTGTVSFASAPNASGVATITITVSDGLETNLPITRTFQVTVRPVNDPPVISPIANQSILEDTAPLRIPFSIGDVEENSEGLIVSASAQGVLPVENIELSGSGSNRWVQVTPPTNAFGTTVITLAVQDTQGGRGSTSFELNIVPVNDWPTLNPIADIIVLKNSGQHTIPLTGISSGVSNEMQTLTVSAGASPEGILRNIRVVYTSPETTGSLSFETVPDAAGDVMVSATVNDGCSSNNLVTRAFRVRVNSPPVIETIADLTIQEDSGMHEIAYILTDVESTPDLLALTVTSSNQALVSDENIRIVRAGTNGSIVLGPSTNAFGITRLTLIATDPEGGITTNSFQVIVAAANDPPTLNPLGDITIDEDAGMQRIPLSGIASGATNEQQTLVVSVVVSPPGILTNVQVSYVSPETTGSLSFGTVSNANGSVNVTVQVDDGAASDNVVARSFVVNVLPINDPPTISPMADQTINEDNLLGPISFQVSDLETTNLTVTASSSNPALVPSANIVLGGSGCERTIQILPATNQFGSAAITVRVRDEGGLETGTSFNLTVTPVNDTPYISVIADQVTDEDVPKRIDFEVGDAESPAESLTVLGVSSNPDLMPAENLAFSGTGSNRVLTLLPAADQYGRATITITASDPDGSTNSRTFEIVVNSVNDAPTLDPISDMTIDEDSGPHVVNLSGLSSGSSNEVQTLVVTAVSSDPSLIPDPVVDMPSSGKLTFAPATNANGSATIYVQVNDGQSENNLYTQSFEVTVRPVNDLPTISEIPDQVTNENHSTSEIPFTVGDVETPADRLLLGASSSNPTLLSETNIFLTGNGSNRTIRLVPALNEFGSATVTLVVTDEQGGVTARTFAFTVNPVRPPTISLSRTNEVPVILVNSASGLRYTVEYKDALSSANWTELGVQTGTGAAIEFEDTGASGTSRFYRVRVE